MNTKLDPYGLYDSTFFCVAFAPDTIYRPQPPNTYHFYFTLNRDLLSFLLFTGNSYLIDCSLLFLITPTVKVVFL